MIFVSVGSLRVQLNRLFEYLDRLVDEKVIDGDEIFAQRGYSDYKIQNFKSCRLLNKDELDEHIKNCDILICHGGTGTVVKGLENNKKIIIVPRLRKFKEHCDDHQLELAEVLEKSKQCLVANDYEELKKCLKSIDDFSGKKFVSNTEHFVTSLKDEINNILNKK